MIEGGQIKYSSMTSCIKEAGLVGGASTHRRFRHLYSSERSSIDINREVVRHTSEPVDYCPRCLGGEHTCVLVYGAVKQLAGIKSFAYALPGLE